MKVNFSEKIDYNMDMIIDFLVYMKNIIIDLIVWMCIFLRELAWYLLLKKMKKNMTLKNLKNIMILCSFEIVGNNYIESFLCIEIWLNICINVSFNNIIIKIIFNYNSLFILIYNKKISLNYY